MIDNRGIDSDLENTVAALLRPPLSASSGPLRFADFYPGLGAASLAARNLGLELAYAVEPDMMIRRAYVMNMMLQPKERIPLSLDNLPDADIVSVHLGYAGFEDKELQRVGSRFHETARLLRVRRPHAILVDAPRHTNLGAVAKELELLDYITTQQSVGDLEFIVGMWRHRLLIDWPADIKHNPKGEMEVREISDIKGFSDRWWVTPDSGLNAEIIWNAAPLSVMEALLSQIANAIRR